MTTTVYLGVDTGGTFTDFVAVQNGQVRVHKCLSTPDSPERAILDGIRAMGLWDVAAAGGLVLVHGSTVATNAALEGKGVRTAFVTNRGFADMLTIGRQTRDELYNLLPPRVSPPVPRELCLETGGRVAADGSVIEPLTEADITALIAALDALAPQAVAINFLFSYLDGRAETRVADAVAAAFPEMFISCSSVVLPEYREYERGMATWLNAWLGPLVARYLRRLQAALPSTPLTIMQSSGGTIDAAGAALRAVNLLLSGPAGGLAAARHCARDAGWTKLMTFDMGGTSSDVALIDGDIRLTSEARIGRYPVAVPMVDMHTIGAGGGSIAYIDEGGALRVGPESAGADPGPACYARGGTQTTVTDANVVLGRLPDNARLGGELPLDAAAARQAVAQLAQVLGMTVEDTAAGIVDIANEHMLKALRVISVQRGHDPEQFALCCFGGAGGLHVCALAEGLGARDVLVPAMGGVLSALGMLLAPRERQLSKTLNVPLRQVEEAVVVAARSDLADSGRRALLAEGVVAEQIVDQPSVDLCYQGQSFTLNLPWDADAAALERAFHQAHEQRYGHRLHLPVLLVNLRLAMRAPALLSALPASRFAQQAGGEEARQTVAGQIEPVPRYQRDALVPGQCISGPALICESVATTWLETGWIAESLPSGHLHLRRRFDRSGDVASS